MDAIICNAGKGSRLGPLGIHTRKCLFRDAHSDKSILWYQLDALHELGVARVVVVIPAADTQIKAEVARLHDRHPGMTVACVPVSTKNVLESIAAGLEHTHADLVVRLDGDVCVLNRRDLLALRDLAKNAICCYEPSGVTMNDATPVVRDGRIAFWRPGAPRDPVWACIDLWRREDLARIVADAASAEGGFMFHRINRLQDELPASKADAVAIPLVYEIDTPEDWALLQRAWEQHARNLEQESLAYWIGLEQYPSFTVDKSKLWEIDAELVITHTNGACRLLEIGAGQGRLIDRLLARCQLERYSVVEPNKQWADAIATRYACEPRVRVHTCSVAEYNASEDGEQSDLAVGFGWAPYLITDASLHQSLNGLRASRLLLKAPEPPQERFSRLRVDHYSKELGTRYISLYRSASETCRLVRNAGWIVEDLQREIYPRHLESAYGGSTFLIVAARP